MVELDFQRGGQTVYKSVNFAGYVGVLTGMKPQKFTLTLDERFSMEGGFVGIIRWLLGDRSANWAGFLMRDVLEKADSYHQALTTLTTSKLLAPVYFILAGNATDQVKFESILFYAITHFFYILPVKLCRVLLLQEDESKRTSCLWVEVASVRFQRGFLWRLTTITGTSLHFLMIGAHQLFSV